MREGKFCEGSFSVERAWMIDRPVDYPRLFPNFHVVLHISLPHATHILSPLASSSEISHIPVGPKV